MLNLLPIVVAGLMNGSFVVPAKYIKRLSKAQIWLYHSIIGLDILPWLILTLFYPNAFHVYTLLPLNLWWLLLGSGLLFGWGQVLFADAIETIGIALSFTINLGIGVTLGSLFVVFYQANVLTHASFFVILAVLLILSSLILYYHSAKTQQNDQHLHRHYQRGWLFAALTGVTSGLQNIAFVIVAFHSKVFLPTTTTFWVWPPFLLAASLPMCLSFCARIRRSRSFISFYPVYLNLHKLCLITLMGVLFTGSLALYSEGMSQLSPAQRMIGWPLFMISIILTSQAWGGLWKELRHMKTRQKCLRIASIILLIVAIALLSTKVN